MQRAHRFPFIRRARRCSRHMWQMCDLCMRPAEQKAGSGTDLSSSAPIDRWARSARPEGRCTTHRKNGDRCKNAARLGTNVCDFHGAKAPQVKRKAHERLEEASDRLARELLKMATDPAISESVRLSAIKDALDRGGLSAKSAVEVEVGPLRPWEQSWMGG